MMILVTFLGVVVAVMNFQQSLSFSKEKEVILIYSNLIRQASDFICIEDSVTDSKTNWVTASRLIFQAEKAISPALSGIYGDIATSKRISSIIEFRDASKVLESKLPEVFFFGSGYQGSSIGHGAYQGIKRDGSEWIHDWSVIIIYKYAFEDLDVAFLDSYEEVVNNKSFREKLFTLGQEGPSRYLYFRKNFARVNDLIIYKKDKKRKYESEIDCLISSGFSYDVE